MDEREGVACDMGVTCPGTQRNRTFNFGFEDTGLKSLAALCMTVLLWLLIF